MAEQMLQMGAIKDPAQYFMVINTGKLDVMTEGTQAQLLCIKGENESLMAGEVPSALIYDDHKQHVVEHLTILADPDLRKNPDLVQNVLDHVQTHLDLARQADPGTVQWLGYEPIPPQQQSGPPADPQQTGAPSPDAPPPPVGSPDAQGLPTPEETMGPTLEQAAPGTSLPGLPNLPKPPGEFANLPINPAEATLN
jgi:hypothetical protein